jgi:tetratricopeptide (TPR) repeat protein
MTNRLAVEVKNNERAGIAVALNRAALLSEHDDSWPPANLFPNPHEDSMLRLLSFGGSLLKAGREEDVIRWTTLLTDRYPGDARVAELTSAALNSQLVKFIKAGRFTDARRMLNENESHLSSADLAKLEVMLADAELTDILNRLATMSDADNALRLLTDAEARQTLSARRITELRVFVISKQAEMLFNMKDWSGGVTLLENALARYGKNTQLENNLRTFRANAVQIQADALISTGNFTGAITLLEETLATYGRNTQIENYIRIMRSNRAVELHNAFAGLFNAHKYEEARVLIRDALKEFPNDRRLLQDKSLADKAQ